MMVIRLTILIMPSLKREASPLRTSIIVSAWLIVFDRVDIISSIRTSSSLSESPKPGVSTILTKLLWENTKWNSQWSFALSPAKGRSRMWCFLCRNPCRGKPTKVYFFAYYVQTQSKRPSYTFILKSVCFRVGDVGRKKREHLENFPSREPPFGIWEHLFFKQFYGLFEFLGHVLVFLPTYLIAYAIPILHFYLKHTGVSHGITSK